MTYTLPEPTAWAISFDGKTPYKLSDYGDGALLDAEIKRQGGATCKLALYTAETLDSEVDKAYKEGFSHGLKECTPWEDAIIDGLVVAHIYRKEHDTAPRLALQDLISWHVRVALDPKVSSDAQALVDKGAAHWRDEWSEVCNENQCLINVLRDTLAKIERYEVKRWDDETFADVVSKIKEVLK